MQKLFLERFIQKYNLSGAAESVELVAANGTLSTRFISDDMNCAGSVSTNSVPLEDGTYRLMHTATLLKLLNVLGDNISVTVKKIGTRTVAFLLSDGKNKATFTLADLTPTVPQLSSPPLWNIEIPLDPALMSSYLKAKSAMNDIDVVTVVCDGTTTELVLGHEAGRNTNNVSLSCDATTLTKITPINFSSKYLRDVILANKEAKSGMVKVSDAGLMNVTFDVDDFTVDYWIVEKT